MKIEYIKNENYLIPNLTLSELQTQPIGKYGQMRQHYLQEHHVKRYNYLVLSEKLYPHLLEIDHAVNERLEGLMPPQIKVAGITVPIKAADQMKWVGLMNMSKVRAEEFIFAEFIFDLLFLIYSNWHFFI